MSSGEPILRPRVGRGRGQPPPQLQRGLQAHRLGVPQPPDARQLRHVHPEQPAQPAVLGQQPLGDIGDRLAHDPG